MKSTAVIIVAGGSGSRMESSIPKQFMPLNGRPILVHTVEKFLSALPNAQIIVVLPTDSMAIWSEICAEYNLEHTHTVCAGGENRFMSVKNGLVFAGGCDYIAVHDGVRPLLSEKMIIDTLIAAKNHGSAIPVIEAVDSFRIINGQESKPIDRTLLRAVQTPQIFFAETLYKAYDIPYNPLFTDDASVVEHSGTKVHLCAGEQTNIKITRAIDIVVAEAIIRE